jgi:cobalamin biosynthesis protein CobD/CbiB
MGFRRFSHALSAIVAALQAGDLQAARRALGVWRGGSTLDLSAQDVARLAIERGLIDAYRQVFAVLFWFVVLPGPLGAVLYRAAVLLADEWRGPVPGVAPTPQVLARAEFGHAAQLVLACLDWIPVRLTALSFAVVGDFEDAVACWRTKAARRWASCWRRAVARSACNWAARCPRWPGIPMHAPIWAWAIPWSRKCCRLPWVSCGARWCCGCC